MSAYVLIVVALNSVYFGNGYNRDHPTVSMQEFGSEKACLFAREVTLRRAGGMQSRLNVVCVPKG